MGSRGSLVPVRFMVTVIHFIASVMVSYTQEENIIRAVGLSADANTKAAAMGTMGVLLGISYTCFVIDLVGLMLGFTMFSNSLNLLHICLHFFGALAVSWFILYSWHYEVLWYCVVGTNIIPTSFELFAWVKILFCKVERY